MRSMHSWQNVPEREIPAESQNNMEAVVKRALALGINHLETARAYGTSELQLRRVLRDLPRDGFLLQTKVRPMDDPDRFRADVLDSLGRLGVERLDLLAIHGISRYRQLGHDMPWVRGNNAAVRQFDLSTVAEKAGLQTEELVRRLQAAHHLFTEEAAG